VLRGGSWDDDASYCRSANRDGVEPAARNNVGGGGLRLVLVVPVPGPK
jgi:formylglycine-generating enzyme required for sulfatase activity